SRHGKPDDAARATLAIIVNDLSPAHARTLLVTLSDAWHNAQRCPYDERPAAILAEVQPALRRLQTTSAEETGAISAIQEQIAFGWEEGDVMRDASCVIRRPYCVVHSAPSPLVGSVRDGPGVRETHDASRMTEHATRLYLTSSAAARRRSRTRPASSPMRAN